MDRRQILLVLVSQLIDFSISTEIIGKPMVLMEVNSLNPLNASVAPI